MTDPGHLITPAVLDAFRRGEAAAATRARHIATGCPAAPGHRHCATCDEYLQAGIALHRELNLKLWEISPLDATGPRPTTRGDGYSEIWPMAAALRRELLAALEREA